MEDGYAYIRRSVGRDDSGSLADQIEDIRKLAESLSVDLPEDRVYVDDDTSGSKKRGAQTAWVRLLKILRADRPAYLLGWKMDRLGRRLGDLEDVDDLGRSQGLKVWTVQEGDVFRNPAWPFLAAQAKAESMNTRVRVSRAHERRRSQGLPTGVAVYGYGDDRMTPREDEAQVIREIFERVASGHSVSGIAANLRSREVPRPQGSEWQTRVVTRILKNPRYAGLLTYQGEVLREGTWQPIVSRDLFDRANAARQKTNRAGRPWTSLLGGLFRCQVPHRETGEPCGKPVASDSDGRGVKTYACNRTMGGCGRLTRQQKIVDEYVVGLVLPRIEALAREQATDELDEEDYQVGQAQVQLDLDTHLLKERYAADKISAADYFDTLDVMRRKQRQLETRQAELNQRRVSVELTQHAATAWDDMTQEQRRAVIRDHVVAILGYPVQGRGRAARIVQPGEIELIWRDGPKPTPDPVCEECGCPISMPKRNRTGGPYWCDECSEKAGALRDAARGDDEHARRLGLL